ncbi:tetratricopeptide repeat protein [Niveispirillum sp. KHB5.9]|uniref:tetratricopeptide repeat protein n=1 Tax=Niveispirillum sp. KHB5.9 TaxID=3400269 RepID=UPI003A837E98
MTASPLLYNQSTLSDDDFVANFVARTDVLETLLRRLRAIDPDGGGDHQILIGARGMGKSSLLRRLAIAINRDPELAAQFIPLTFREEQYNILAIGDFWRNCGESLAEWAEQAGLLDLATSLDKALPTSAWAGDDAPIEQLNKALAQLQRRPVLLVDNLDLILNNLKDKQHWVLRRYLQDRRGPIMVGAATQSLEQSADRKAAFYDFFYHHHLEPLNQRDTETCMRALAHRRGDHGLPVIRVLNSQPERLRTLHTLTGGNPRVLTLIYRLLEASETNEAMADLDNLLDHVTPYYKARIEEYQTAQQRAVIDAIALHWDPITVGILADITNIATTTLSPMLIKLRKDGLIETTDVSGSSTGHQIAERFLNIWYLMRHGTRRTKHKLRWLVHFLNSFYSADELDEISKRISAYGMGQLCHPDYQMAIREAYALSKARGAIGHSLVEAVEGANHPATSENTLHDDKLATAVALLSQGHSLVEKSDFLTAVSIFTDIITRFGDDTEPRLQELVAWVMVKKGFAHGQMGDHSAEIVAYETVIDRFAEDTAPNRRILVAMALVNKGFAHSQMGDHSAAIAACDSLVASFADDTDPDRQEQVAMALVNKGFAHGNMGDHSGAIATFDSVIARFADDTNPDLQEQAAWAMVAKCAALGEMGDHNAAIAICDSLIARFTDDTTPGLRVQVARAMVSKCAALSEMGDHNAAIATCDSLIARFADDTTPDLRVHVARAMVNKGVALGEMGDHSAAIATLDSLIARFVNDTAPDLREQVARAMVIKGVALDEMGDQSAAIATFDSLITRFAADTASDLRVHVARAMVNKGVALDEMGDHSAAIATFDSLIVRFADDTAPGLREEVAGARINLGDLLIETGGDLVRARELFQAAIPVEPVLANANLAWTYLLDDQVSAAQVLWPELEELPPHGKALLESALALGQDNFGLASDSLSRVLNGELDDGGWYFADDLNRLFRLMERKGYGDRLITWFEETDFADKVAPLYVALKAFVRGEAVLLDVNPEVRGPAQFIYYKMDAPRRHRRQTATEPPSRRRGRPRKT